MSTKYTDGFKEAALQKLLMPGGPSMLALSRELGVHVTTIKYWRDKYSKLGDMKKSNKKKQCKDWSPADKLLIIGETSSLSENDLGTYLRKKGLHSTDIDQWKESFFESQKIAGRPKLAPETVALRRDKKILERDLNRKDKALAEMSARIILLKKSHEIFGVREDDE